MAVVYFLVLLVLVFVTFIKVSKDIESMYFKRAFQAGILLWLTAAVIKILHLPGANLMLLVAILVLLLSKGISLTRQKWGILDMAILLWLTDYFVVTLIRTMSLIRFSETMDTVIIVFEVGLFVWVFVGLFYWDKRRQDA